jgi:hypothetical protein
MLLFQKAHRRHQQDSRHVKPIQRAATTGSDAFAALTRGFGSLESLDTSIRRSKSHSSVLARTSVASAPAPRELTDEQKAAKKALHDAEDNSIVERELLMWETDPLLTVPSFGDLTSFWAVRLIESFINMS